MVKMGCHSLFHGRIDFPDPDGMESGREGRTMSGNLEAVFSQVVVACSIAALAAIVMRELTTDRTLHLCARMLGLSAWAALLSLSYFTVREYEKLERVLVVRQSTKVVEPTSMITTKMELPSGITLCWTRTDTGRRLAVPDLSGPPGGSWHSDRHVAAVGGGSGQAVPGVSVEATVPGTEGGAPTF